MDTAGEEVLDPLEPDETGADHDGVRVGSNVEEGHDAVHVLHAAQGGGGDAAIGPAGRGAGARRDDQVVVHDRVDCARVEIAHRDGLRARVDADDLVPHPHVETEARRERLGGLQQKRRPVGDHAADVVREAAVRE